LLAFVGGASVATGLGTAAVAAGTPCTSHGHQLGPLFETLDRLAGEVDQQLDVVMAAESGTSAQALAAREFKRLQALRDRAFEALAAAPARNRAEIERKFAIVYDWMGCAVDKEEPFLAMLDSVRRDFRALTK